MAIKRLKEVKSTNKGLVGVLSKGGEVSLSEPKQFLMCRPGLNVHRNRVYADTLITELLNSPSEGDDIYIQLGEYRFQGCGNNSLAILSYNCYAEKGKDISLLTHGTWKQHLLDDEQVLLKWDGQPS